MEREKRLIDANALKKQFIDYVRTQPHFHYGDWQNMCINGTEIDEVIENATTVDAVEVVHSRWIKGFFKDTVECFECFSNDICKCYETKYNYCPNCGAKMDGDGNG